MSEAQYREARRRAGLRPEEVCASLGVSVTTLMGWERGETSPKGPTIADMAKMYGVSTDALLGIVPIDAK